MIGIRCRGDDETHANCRNPRCTCPQHDNEDRAANLLAAKQEMKSRGRKRGQYRSAYHMDEPERGETYEFQSR